MDAKNGGRIRLVEKAGVRAALEISLPPGTQLKAAPHVVARIDELIQKLTSCPCNSGIDLIFHDGLVNPVEINEHVALGG